MSKNKTILTLTKIRKILDLLIQYTPFIFIGIWSAQAIYDILTKGILSHTMLWTLLSSTIKVHSITVFIIIAFYMYCFFHLNKFDNTDRVPLSMGITIFSVVFYDFIWNILYYLINHTKFFGVVIPTIPVLVTYIILTLYNMKYHIFKFSGNFFIYFFIYLFFMFLLTYTGFFQQYYLFERGLAPDPHGWIWFISKVTGICMWSNLY